MTETEYFDVIVIIPLEEELRAFEAEFKFIEDRSTSTELRHIVDSGAEGVRMLVAQQEEMGKSCASRTTSQLLDEYDAGLVICLGIAGSISNDVHLGDVCYSGTIIDVYDNSRVVDLDIDKTDTELSPTQFATNREVTVALNFVRTQPDLIPGYQEWQTHCEEIATQAVPHAIPGRDGAMEQLSRPQSKNGSIVCGPVSKSETYNKKIRALDRKVLAIETESGGVFAQAATKSIPALTIRGISDYADRSKGDLEKNCKGLIRQIAAANAASFLRLQLRNSRLLRVLELRRCGPQSQLSLVPKKPKADELSESLAELGGIIDGKLRELSPEFKLQAKGYRLPIPRVRKVDYPTGVDEPVFSEPLEIREALDGKEKILINVPRTYPDQSLAWVLANDLMSTELGGKQVVPVVIDGDMIKLPRSGIELLSPLPLGPIRNHSGAQLVIIVDNVPLSSKTRLNFLIKEVSSLGDAKFIFITRGDVNLVFESEFSAKISADIFHVCEISFIEIAHFIQKNFSMTGSEAEVIALRLRETFHRFDLAAHPTYFAGIPKETLSALLQANRRSELIQLAVDGFLTFLVADDKGEVTLSRTTRARFLKRLVVEMKLEKRNFDQATLIAFTKQFSTEYDFAINPLEFIQAFIEQGIMHFEDDRVRLSLPFIECYLLAAELADSPAKAASYFSLQDPDFDLTSFDLYAEIGAANDLVSRILDALDESVKNLSLTDDDIKHILLTEKVSPSNIGKPERLQSLRNRLKKAADDVRNGRDDARKKQQLLDINDQVRELTAKQSRDAAEDDEQGESGISKQLAVAADIWLIGTILLGSGAEHLDATTKRALAALLIKLGALVIHHWTSLQLTIDFKAIKAKLLSDDTITSLANARGGDLTPEEIKPLVSSLVDLLEYSTLADPLRKVVGQLCEQARHRVLATSVENATIDGVVEQILHGTWLADIDSKRGRPRLRGAIRALPKAPFIRIALASHYMSRVYWNHSRPEDRLILLDAAEEAIKPLSVQINKAEVKRIIEQTPPQSDTDL